MRVSARRSYCIHDVGRETREKERERGMEKLHWLVGGTVERCSYPGGIWTPIYTLLSPPFPLSPLSRSLLLSLSHSISLSLIRLAFTLATILPCSETQARHMDPGTINTRFPNQRPSLSRSLSFIISVLFSLSLTHFLCPVLYFCFILFLHLSRFHIYSIRQPLRHRG